MPVHQRSQKAHFGPRFLFASFDDAEKSPWGQNQGFGKHASMLEGRKETEGESRLTRYKGDR